MLFEVFIIDINKLEVIFFKILCLQPYTICNFTSI